MRVTRLMMLALSLSLLLGGCQLSGEVENQAYVLMLGVDRQPDGQLGLTARIPKIGKSAGDNGDDASGGSPYLTFSVSGEGWDGALDALQWATPRRTNLSHLELLVVSEALAREDGFPDLLRQIVETPHLYATARPVVCEGRAADFVNAGETIIGTRMSAELRAMLRHYTEQGYIPGCSLADAYYAANSAYSDSTAIWAALEADAVPSDEASNALQVLASPMRQRFYGAALLSQGAFVARLSLEETQLLNLILGRTRTFSVESEGARCDLTPHGRAGTGVDIDQSGNARLRLSLRLSADEAIPEARRAAAEQALQAEIESLVRACQRLRCDPFGFAERAARRFPTFPEWLAYDWRSRYAEARLEVSVRIDGTGTG